MRHDDLLHDQGREPWATDPDAWRAEADAPPPARGEAWPQLDAGPLYWMWLEAREREAGS